MNHTRGRVACCSARKTDGLEGRASAQHGFTGIIAGIRRDEEGTRAKERVFSPRAENGRVEFPRSAAGVLGPVQHRLPARRRICASIRCCIGPSSTSGATSGARRSRWSISISRANGKRYRSLGVRAMHRPRSRATAGDDRRDHRRARRRPRIAERAGRAHGPGGRGRLRAPARRRLHVKDVPANHEQRPGPAHRHRRPCRSRQVDAGRPAAARHRRAAAKARSRRCSEASRKRGMPFEWAFLMDALQAERDQGITIDTTRIRFAQRARATTSSSTRRATTSSSRTW